MKTIREHLEQLPEPARSQALANMYLERAFIKYINPADAVKNAFTWSTCPEGRLYWFEIWSDLMKSFFPDTVIIRHENNP